MAAGDRGHVGQGLLRRARTREDGGEPLPGLRVRRLERDDAREVADGETERAPLFVEDGELHVGGREVWRLVERAIQRGARRGRIALAAESRAEAGPSEGDVGADADGFAVLADGFGKDRKSVV